MELNSSDLSMLNGAFRHAGFRLISADTSEAYLSVTVTGANLTVDGLDRAVHKRAAARFISPADGRTEIPWRELSHSEKFQVIGDLLAILRRTR